MKYGNHRLEQGEVETNQVACPHQGVVKGIVIVVTDTDPPRLVSCQAHRQHRNSGGCLSGGCCFLGPRTINQCPFDR